MTAHGHRRTTRQRPHGHKAAWMSRFSGVRRFVAPISTALVLALVLLAVVPGNTSANDTKSGIAGGSSYGIYLAADQAGPGAPVDNTNARLDKALLLISGIANGFDPNADVNPITTTAKGAKISWEDGSSITVHLFVDDELPDWMRFNLLYLDSAQAQPRLVGIRSNDPYDDNGVRMAFAYSTLPRYGSSLHNITLVARTSGSEQVITINIVAHKVSVEEALRMLKQVLPYTGE